MMATTPNHYLIVCITISIFSLAVYFPESAAQYGSLMFPSYNMPADFLNSRVPHRMEPHFSHNVWPPSRPLSRPPYSSYSRPPINARPRPHSPAHQCRIMGACREVNHGTPLPTTWRLQKATPMPATRYTVRTTTEPLIDRFDSSPTTLLTTKARLNMTTVIGFPIISSPMLTFASSPTLSLRPTSLGTTTTKISLATPSLTRATTRTTSSTTKLEDGTTDQASSTSSNNLSVPFTTSATPVMIIVGIAASTNETDAFI